MRREQREPPKPCLASSPRAAACWSLIFGVGKAKFPQEESPGASPPCSPSPSAFRVGFRAFWGRAACSQLQGCVISHLSFLAFFSLKFSSFLPAQWEKPRSHRPRPAPRWHGLGLGQNSRTISVPPPAPRWGGLFPQLVFSGLKAESASRRGCRPRFLPFFTFEMNFI